jgi:uncharacterized membrane protein
MAFKFGFTSKMARRFLCLVCICMFAIRTYELMLVTDPSPFYLMLLFRLLIILDIIMSLLGLIAGWKPNISFMKWVSW